MNRVRIADRLRAEFDEADARRELRSLHELRDSLHAGGEADANRHAENLFGELRHAFEENGAARENRAGRELLEKTGVFDALANRREHFLGARLDDVGEHAPRATTGCVSADAGDLDLFFVRDE